MIKSLKVVNSYGEELTMTLNNPRESGYAITGITGLEPVNVDIKQTQMVSGLKYKYNKGFHKYRQIQISIIYDEWNTKNIDELRQDLYKYFKTNDLVTLYFTKEVKPEDKRWYIKTVSQTYPIEIYVTQINGEYGTAGAITFVKDSDGYLYLDDPNYDNSLTGIVNDMNHQYFANIWIDNYGRLYCDSSYMPDIELSGGSDLIVTMEEIPDIKAIQGWVDQHNSVYFSNNCGVTISIICPDPWFRKTDIEYTDNVDLTITNNGQQDNNGLYVYEANINYLGNIQTGIKIDFSNDIMYILGNHMDIFSNHLESDTGELVINSSTSYVPGESHDYDVTRMYVTDSGDIPGQYNLTFVNITGPVIFELKADRYFYLVDPNYDLSFVGINNSNMTVYLDRYGRMFTYDDLTADGLDLYYGGTLTVDVLNTTPSSNRYLEVDTTGDYLSVISKSYQDPTVYDDVIGWVDANSISMRKNLPILYPGNNTIIVKSTQLLEDPLGNVGKVYYNTLTRGL